MKLLATIQSVRLVRSYQRQDGTYANIFGVTIESGDDILFAETFISKEAQQKRGIVPDAIGTAVIQFGVRYWNDKQGVEHVTQDVRLTDFVLANRNFTAHNAASGADSPTAQPQAESASASPAEASEQKIETNGLIF